MTETLLRLRGDPSTTTGTSKVIDNFLREPIFLAGNAKIALVNANFTLADDLNNESFLIVAGDTITVGGGGVADVTVQPTAGTYNAETLLDEVEKQLIANCGYSTQGTFRAGMDFKVYRTNDTKVNIQKAKTSLTTNKFLSEWHIENGAPTVTDTGAYTGSAGTVADEVISNFPLGNAAFTVSISGLRNNTDGLTYYVKDIETGDIVAGIRAAAAGNYFVTYAGGAETDTGVAVTAGDGLRIIRNKNGLQTFYIRAGTATQLTAVSALTTNQAYNYRECYVHLGTPIGSANGCTGGLSTLYDLPPNLVGATAQTQLTISFGTTKLAGYLGYKNLTYTVTGNPAVVISENVMQGSKNKVGVLIVLDDFILDSYDGAKEAKGRNSIVYVVGDHEINGRNISFSAPFPIKLAIKNRPTSITQLRVSFRSAENNALLEVVGQASLTFVIYEE